MIFQELINNILENIPADHNALSAHHFNTTVESKVSITKILVVFFVFYCVTNKQMLKAKDKEISGKNEMK
jgi:hypothetical protein